MTTTSIVRLGTAVLALAVASPPEATKPEEQPKRIAWANTPDVLVGLKEVNLHIGIRGDAKNPKAGEAYLRTRIEKQLRQAGLTAVTNEQATASKWPVMLAVVIESRGIQEPGEGQQAAVESGLYLVTVNVDDIVVPARDDGAVILGATTWSRRRFGYAARSELASKSMDDALALIDQLCQDFQKAQERPLPP